MKQVQAVNNQVESIYGITSINDNKRGSMPASMQSDQQTRSKKHSVSQPPNKAEGIKSIRTMTSSNFNQIQTGLNPLSSKQIENVYKQNTLGQIRINSKLNVVNKHK